MKITKIRNKKLVATLGESEPVDEVICRRIIDHCRRRDVYEVALVYPFRRLEEVKPFMREVVRVTGRPVQGFSHDSHDMHPERVN